MSKGLSIARAFYREGHNVVGADFEPSGVPVCGRFSVALKKFYRLPKPEPGVSSSKGYAKRLLEIIKLERVDLWVSCSGVASALEDAEAGEWVQQLSSCMVVQFGVDVTETLHQKHSFIQQARGFGLNVPETHFITSVNDALTELYSPSGKESPRQFIMKSIGLDDAIRADLTLLPRSSLEQTCKHLTRLDPTVERPFVLQQFISGAEYCTHSILVRGKIVAFTACPSAELLMHYKALSDTSDLFAAMRSYTKQYAERMGNVTGHFSIDFMVEGADYGPDLINRLYPIECNPRAHTAVVLFDQETEVMVKGYLQVLGENCEEAFGIEDTSIPKIGKGYYWIGHDVVTLFLLPFVDILMAKITISSFWGEWREFLEHLIYWKDGTYEIWDPVPFWWLYCIYWPGTFCDALVTRNWWSRCNVSTTKLFRC